MMRIVTVFCGIVAITGISLVAVLTIDHLIEKEASETSLIAATAMFTTVVNQTMILLGKLLDLGGKDDG